jgi:hypothetical protein
MSKPQSLIRRSDIANDNVTTEDAFVVPKKKINHEPPPKDPEAPSGSLSSDDAEAIAVDFGIPGPTHPNT